jgi:integrase
LVNWEDGLQAALENYNKQKDALHAGRTPRADPATLTDKTVANDFLHAKEEAIPSFKRTSKKTLRLHRAKQGAKLVMAKEVRRMIDAAGPSMRAMVLLGINCGFGNADCGTLPLSAVELQNSMIDYPRPKTGIRRRCALWPETIQAIHAVLCVRHQPKREEGAGLVFITKYGTSWSKDDNAGPVTQEVRNLLNRLCINGHRNFYTLRHTFRTVADESKDQPAIFYVMGHELPDMSSLYREAISDDRLRAVADHVRKWLFPSATSITVRVTEGALKADIATDRSGVLTIGLPGVSVWRQAAKVLRELGAKVVRVA